MASCPAENLGVRDLSFVHDAFVLIVVVAVHLRRFGAVDRRQRYPEVVSEQRQHVDRHAASLTIEELGRAQHASQVMTAEELAADIWESDEELDEFLADLRASRDASTA